jgi:hypothetical protein
VTFKVLFEKDNALLLQNAQQRLQQSDIGPFSGKGGQVLHVVTVAGPDQKLAFERARVIRAALVRQGSAEARALAAAAWTSGTGTEAADLTASIQDVGGQTEEVEIKIMRLNRPACVACTASTFGTLALDSAAVRQVTMAETMPAGKVPAATESTARSADRRERPDNLAFTDGLPVASVPAAPMRRAAKSDAPTVAYRKPAAGGSPTTIARERAHQLAHEVSREPAVAAAAALPKFRTGKPVEVSMLSNADRRALGLAAGPGCTAQRIIIDDYSAPRLAWRC